MKRPVEPDRPRKPSEPSKPQEYLAPVRRCAYVYDGTKLQDLIKELGEGNLESASFDISNGYDGDSAEVVLYWNDKEVRPNNRYPLELKRYNKSMLKYAKDMIQYKKDMEVYESSYREYKSLEKQYLRWFHKNELSKLD